MIKYWNEKLLKIWKQNQKKGYRFFDPINAHKPIPRTLREAVLQKGWKFD